MLLSYQHFSDNISLEIINLQVADKYQQTKTTVKLIVCHLLFLFMHAVA